ncbi:SH3 domain-containing protein [Chloroflexota bacterium]
MSSSEQPAPPLDSETPQDESRLGELRDILLREDKEYLIETIKSVISPALARQIDDAEDEVSDTLAPVIGPTIRRQIEDSQEVIVDALYPIIGKTIRRAVAEAMRDLARRVDENLRNPFGVQRVIRRIRARLQGVSEAELLLREALPFRVQEVFLIHRDSGLLLAHLSSQSSDALDRDLVSGMLTAIRDFAQDAFGDEQEGELDAIQYGTLRIRLEPGRWAYLAVVVEGIAPEGFGAKVEDALSDVYRAYAPVLREYDGDPEGLAGVEDLLQPLLAIPPADPDAVAEPDAPPRLPWLAIVATGAILVLCLSLSCFGFWQFTWGRPTAMPTAIAVPAATATFTSIPTLTPTSTPTHTPTSTPTHTPTSTPTSTPSHTPTTTHTPTPTSTSTPVAAPTPYLGVMIGNVRLRSEPRDNSPLIGVSVNTGRPVEVLAIYQEWYLIRWPPGDSTGTVGWIPGRWVGVVAVPPPEIITPGP